ncbi:MAG: hypothetical protein E2O39_05320 [Planctomycetota bacterium]|nr:MAG: hypothetical protein E2O39_05320 [Planctomycetota bacterium]
MLRTSHARFPRLTPLLLLTALAGGCGNGSSSNDSNTFKVRNTHYSVAASTPVVTSGHWLAFLASEVGTGDGMGGANSFLNGDADVLDSVVIVVRLTGSSETNVAVAAESITWAGDDLYIAVNEADDSVDWDGDGDMLSSELSLVHWSDAAGVATFVASLDTAGAISTLAVGDLLFFPEEVAMAPGMNMTSLRVIDTTVDPLAFTTITTQSLATTGLQPRLMGGDEGLVFVYMCETVDAYDLNGDGDMTDAFVLGVLDGTIATGEVMNTELGIANADVPFRADSTGVSDWLVAFLVSEAAQAPLDTLGLNNFMDAQFVAQWRPTQCDSGDPDQDTLDNVLHYIHFDAWAMDPVLNPIRNTGLTGRTRVIVVDGYVGTISSEGDEVNASGCDLNSDSDKLDRISRWTFAVGGTFQLNPIIPPSHPNDDMVALTNINAIPGGTCGLAELDGRMVALVSEFRDDTDYDNNPTNFNLLAWYDPDSSGQWKFDHGTSSSFYGGATWMREVLDREHLMVAMPEDVEDININIPPGKTGPDQDTNDSIPSFSRFNNEPRFIFAIARVALLPDNAGMLIARNHGYYRVDESDDSRDWNEDGDMNDIVLFRTHLSTGNSKYMSPVIEDFQGRGVIFVDLMDDSPRGGAMIADEASQGTNGVDYNGDGDKNDLVIRYFEM